MIALKSAIWVSNLLTALETVSKTDTQVARTQSYANHVQHVERLSCGTCHVPQGTKGQLSYYVWQSLNHIYLSFILLAEPLTNEGGEKTEVPGKNPDDDLQKIPHTISKARKFKPQPRTQPVLKHWWQARKEDVLIITPHIAPSTTYLTLIKTIVLPSC